MSINVIESLSTEIFAAKTSMISSVNFFLFSSISSAQQL